MMWHDPLLLPSHRQLQEIRQRAKRYWSWLHRTYAPSSIATYWSAVLAEHRDHLKGTSLNELGINFPAFKDHVNVFRLRQPRSPPKQNFWTLQHFHDILTTSPRLRHWYVPEQDPHMFKMRTTMAVMATLWTQLLRASEILPSTGAPARAAGALWNLSDVTFLTSDGQEIPWLADGTPDTAYRMHSMKLPMVPSKADKFANNAPLFLPGPTNENDRVLSPAAFVWDLCVFHPVRRDRHHSTPLFPAAVDDREQRFSEASFLTHWKRLCSVAGLPYAQFGKHAFRRGGINRLIDLNCSAPQIGALGRWKTDTWKIYARRNKERLAHITATMTVPSSAQIMDSIPTAPEKLSLHATTVSMTQFSVPSNSRSGIPPRATPPSSAAVTSSYAPHRPTLLKSSVKRIHSPKNSVSLLRSQSKQVTSAHLKALRGNALLRNSAKQSSAPHINSRCEAANGKSIPQARQMIVQDKDRRSCKYNITDIKYDIRKGFLTIEDLSEPSATHVSTNKRAKLQ